LKGIGVEVQNFMKPKLVMCNIFSDMGRLKKFAHDYGFSGIDWSFKMESIPERPLKNRDGWNSYQF